MVLHQLTLNMIKETMNNTTINKDSLLEELNNEKALQMIPVIVLLGILMIIGLCGNTLVCFFYGCKTPQSSNTVFILGVAIFDFLVCTLSIPIEIVDLRFFYLFPYTHVCKIMTFVNYFVATGSALTLVDIAVDRYRKIFKPFKKQLKLTEARIGCVVSVLTSLLLSWPAFVFYRPIPVHIETDDGLDLQGYDCTTTKETSDKVYLLIFNGFYKFCFFTATIILIAMYGLVKRKIYKHHKSQLKYQTSVSTFTKNAETEEADTCKRVDGTVNSRRDLKEKEKEKEGKTNLSCSNAKAKFVTSSNIQKPKRVKVTEFTTVMFAITVVFVVSFVPHLTLSLWREFQAKHEGETLTGAELVAYQIGFRSYLLNSAINPIIYGFFNPRFRAFVLKTFCRYSN